MSAELDAAIARIKAICRDKNKWKSTDIIVPVATSLNNNELVEIDICQTIGKAARRNGDINDLTCYFLDRDQFSKNDNKTRKESVISTFAIVTQNCLYQNSVVRCHCRESF